MTNQPLILTFHGAERGEIPPVSPQQLLNITVSMTDLLQQVSAVAGLDAIVTVTFAGSPRRGSLEIALALEFANSMPGLDAAAEAFAALGLSPGEIVEAGRAITKLVFGEKGLFDLFKRPKRDEPATELDVRCVNNAGVRNSMRNLVQVASQPQAREVTVNVFEGPVTIYPVREMVNAELEKVFQGGQRRPHSIVRDIRGATVVASGSLRDRPAKFIVTSLVEAAIDALAVWLPEKDPPGRNGRATIESRWATAADLADLHIDGPLPSDVSLNSGILIVEDAAIW